MIEADNEDPLDDFEDDDKSGRKFMPDFVRKVAVAGLGAVFMGEEGLRALANQLKLPKEALGYLLQQAEKTKDDVGRVVGEEVRRFLQSDKLRDEFLKLLAGMTVEIKAEVKLVPDRLKGVEGGVLPKVQVGEIKIKQPSKKKKEE